MSLCRYVAVVAVEKRVFRKIIIYIYIYIIAFLLLPASAITATQRHSDNFSDEYTVVSTHTVFYESESRGLTP